MVDNLFSICVRFLQWLGTATGLTYKEISVIFNLWIQDAVLLLSAALPMAVAIMRQTRGLRVSAASWALSSVILVIYLLFSVWLIHHYSGRMDDIFDTCVNDLLNLASTFHTTYNTVNIVIFVILWLLAVGSNILIALQIKK